MRKLIPGFSRYQVDTEGNVWTNHTNGPGDKISSIWQKLKASKSKSTGYFRVGLHKNGKAHHKNIHSLVLETFVGKRPKDMQCCHNNGNRLANLRWDTHKNNVADSIRHGTYVRGEKVGISKLNKYQVQRIRLMKEIEGENLPNRKIKEMFKVSRFCIKSILSRYTWKHI